MAKATQETPPAGGIRPLKKITVRDMLGGAPDIKAIIKNDEANPGAPLWLCEVIGVCTAARPGTVQGTGQTYVRFLGSFQGTVYASGQIFQSGAAILPGAIPDMLFGALQMGHAVQFGFRIGVIFDQTAATKYVYVVESMTKQAATDPLAMLAAAIKSGAELPALPQLSGPTTLSPEIAKARNGA
jgi:hypothetical protein